MKRAHSCVVCTLRQPLNLTPNNNNNNNNSLLPVDLVMHQQHTNTQYIHMYVLSVCLSVSVPPPCPQHTSFTLDIPTCTTVSKGAPHRSFHTRKQRHTHTQTHVGTDHRDFNTYFSTHTSQHILQHAHKAHRQQGTHTHRQTYGCTWLWQHRHSLLHNARAAVNANLYVSICVYMCLYYAHRTRIHAH